MLTFPTVDGHENTMLYTQVCLIHNHGMNDVANMYELLTVLKLTYMYILRESLKNIISLSVHTSIVSTVRMQMQQHEV